MKYLFLLVLLLSGVCEGQAHLDWLSYYGVQKNNYSLSYPTQVVYDSLNHCTYMAGVTNDTLGIATPGSHQEAYYFGNTFGLDADIFLS